MFKKFFDQVLPSSSSAPSSAVRSLQNMGFSEEQARNALSAVGDANNVQGALDLLLSQQQIQSHAPSPPAQSISNQEDLDLQRAMANSLSTENNRRPAAVSSTKAGKAALARLERSSNSFGSNQQKPKNTMIKKAPSSNISSRSASPKIQAYVPTDVRPEIKAPSRMAEKSKEEQITRSVNRIASFPIAVDTLFKALSSLQKEPSNHKFRSLDKSTLGFQRAFTGVPGVDDLLAAINFVPSSGNSQIMTLAPSRVDMALLFLAVSALEQARLSEEYKSSKVKLEFVKLVQDVKEGRKLPHPNYHRIDDEMIARSKHLSQCPSEPPEGRGAIMTVMLGEDTTHKISRRFDADDTLGDVLNWLGSVVGTFAVYQLCETREWSLVDLHRAGDTVPIKCDGDKRKTLQFLGFWPSGKLQLRHSDPLWLEKGFPNEQAGSTRGLGASLHH